MPNKTFKFCIENCLSKTISRYQYKYLYNQYYYSINVLGIYDTRFYLKCDFILKSSGILITNYSESIYLDLKYCKEAFIL